MTTLTGGESIVLVRSIAAFQSRNGPAPRIAGAYGPADSLRNSGETITLLDATGALIQSFTWSDAWFPATDGPGHSMVVRNESAPLTAWNSPAQWGISTAPGGTPASVNIAVAWQFEGWRQTYFNPAELADPLISGPAAAVAAVSNDQRYALGLTPFVPVTALLTASISGNALSVRYSRRSYLLDVQFTIETSSNADAWSPLNTGTTSVSPNGDGTETVTVTIPSPFPTGSRGFLRLRTTLTQEP
jgi:hypothetical protein